MSKQMRLGFNERELGLLGFHFRSLKMIPSSGTQLGIADFHRAINAALG